MCVALDPVVCAAWHAAAADGSESKNEPKVIMGQWHHYHLTAQGDHFVVMFDGKKVLDTRHPEFKSGAIGFQRTGPTTIEFRSIKIKPL